MNPDSRTLIDTNVLVYAVDDESPQHEKAKEIIKTHCSEGNAVLSSQNLAEFIYAVAEKEKLLTIGEAAQFAQDIADNATVISYGANEVARAAHLKQIHGLEFFDALIAATMEEAKLFRIITANDKDFKKISWLEVINPF